MSGLIQQKGVSARNRTARLLMLGGALGVAATVSSGQAAKSPGQRMMESAKRAWSQVGKATWYGRALSGHKTASGERFDPEALTCAHRTLPLGSWIRVTNLLNHRSLLVRVTDRGPTAKGVMVDLSHAAAQRLGIGGVGKVKIEELSSLEARQGLAPFDAPHGGF